MALNSKPHAMELISQQRGIVESPIDSRQLVLGGAGTGKTHALIERINCLIQSNDVAPGSEILVLSFTRAVVRELKARLRLSQGDARLVRPVTFDSFASRLLRELPKGQTRDWRDAGYDGRIAIAREAIAEGGDAAAILGSYRHVFVDEIQDLVSVRADLVLEVLKHIQGFTVLGDPAQAIYEYQVRDDLPATTSEKFLVELIESYPRLSTTLLDEDFRCVYPMADVVAEVGRILRDPQVDDDEAQPLLTEVLDSLDHVDSFDDLAVALRGAHERTAVLCRTNAECLRVSQLLFEAGVGHHLQQEAIEQVLPAWLALLFRGEERTQWSEARLRKLIERRLDANLTLPHPDAVVEYLTDVVRDDNVDVTVLRERLRWSQAPEAPQIDEPPSTVVSTVHRAKGLEFRRVFFGAPRHGVPEDSAEELRVLYVALSRSQDDVWSFKAPNMARWWKPPNTDDRWVKSNWGEPWKTLGWEFRPRDIDRMRPPGAGHAKADVRTLQDRLGNGFAVGSSALLRLVHVRESEESIPFYSVLVDDQVVGETDEHFGETLRRRLRRRNGVTFPRVITDLFVVGVETVVGSVAEGDVHGLGGSGIWLRPRIAGLGRVDWYAE